MRQSSLIAVVLVLGWGLFGWVEGTRSQDGATRPADAPPAVLPSISDLNRLAARAQPAAAVVPAASSSAPASDARWAPPVAYTPASSNPAKRPGTALPATIPASTSTADKLPAPGADPSATAVPAAPPRGPLTADAPTLPSSTMPPSAPAISNQMMADFNRQVPALPALPDTHAPATPAAAPAAPGADTAPAPLTGPQNPMITLEKTAPAAVPLGKSLAYEIIARNTGKIAVNNVHVEEELPAGVQFVSADPRPEGQTPQPTWNLGTLEPAAERHIKIEVQPTAEGNLRSQATATFSVSAAMQTLVTQPHLALTQTGPSAAQVGEQVVFQIQVSNTGTGVANAVVLHERLPAGLMHEAGSSIDADIGILAPGESKAISLQLNATKAGTQTCDASVTAEGSAPANAQTAVEVTEAILTLNKTGPQRRYLNREAEYHIDLANPGTAPAKNVRVAEVLPEGLEFISASDGGTLEPGTRTVSWKFSNLDPGQKQSVSFKVVPRAAGDLISRALAQADRGLEAKAEASMHVEGIPACVLEVVDVDDPIEVGAETTYEIKVVNQGTSAATGLQIVATVPAGMGPRDASGPVGHHVEGQQIVFDRLPQLAPKADVAYKVRVVGMQPGDLRFKVQLMADHLSQPVTAEESTRVYSDQPAPPTNP